MRARPSSVSYPFDRTKRMTNATTAAAMLAAIGLFSLQPSPAVADADSAGGRPTRPLVVLNAAGVDRLLQNADALCKLGQRPDLSLALRAAVSLPTAGLKGVDRSRPFGMMLVIDAGEVPEPVAVYYVPVAKSDVFLAMLKGAGATVEKQAGERTCQVTFHGSRWAVALRNGYAFFASKSKSLRHDFGDPARRFQRLSQSYDLAARVDFDAVPRELKWMLLDYFRARAENDLQRRGRESMADFRLRRAIGRASLSLFESLLTDGRSATLGLSLRRPAAKAELELRVAARSGTPLAASLQHAAVRPQFAVNKPGERGLAVAGSLIPPRPMWACIDAWLRVATGQPLPGRRTGTGPPTEDRDLLQLIGDDVANSGLQVGSWTIPAGTGLPVLVAAAALPNAGKTAPAVRRFLEGLKRAGMLKSLGKERRRQDGLVLQRLTWAGSEVSSGLVAVAKQTVWFAVGRGDLTQTLLAEIRSRQQRGESVRSGRNARLFDFTARWSLLRRLLGAGGPAAAATSPSADRIELEVQRRKSELVLRCACEADVVRAASRALLQRFAAKR